MVGTQESMVGDFERCYRAIASRDARFDGWWVTGVHSTGVYCRPSCPAMTPKRHNVSFYATSAAAQQAGLRACKRCRPDASPGSPEWSARADVTGRAMRLIADGVVDREGVAGLARRLAFSERHLHRLLVGEVGAGPLAIARAQRAQTARALIESTTLPFGEVAFAAGFGSIRQFNETVLTVFGSSPTQLRRYSGQPTEASEGHITLRLSLRRPFAADALAHYLAARAVPGVEWVEGRVLRRAVRLTHSTAVVRLELRDDAVVARLQLADLRDLQTAAQRCRRLLDLDADPEAIDALLARDRILGPMVRATPGLRSPGALDGAEIAVRAIVGQQVSIKAARTTLGGLIARYGETGGDGAGGVNRLFPTAEALAAADPGTLPMPRARGRALVGLVAALATGEIILQPGVDPAAAYKSLVALPGVGPWTASYITMRALGDPDVLLATDLGVRRALTAHGLSATAAAVGERGRAWRPWRSYATHHLWCAAASVAAGLRPH